VFSTHASSFFELINLFGSTMQDVSDSSGSHPPSSSLCRPSFSLELYNHFSQDAINAFFPDNLSVNNIFTDIDIDTDVDADVMAGIPSVYGSNVVPNITRNSVVSEERKPKIERKRVGGNDDGSAKRISARKSSDVIASSHDAYECFTSCVIQYVFSYFYVTSYFSFKYNNSNRPLFIVQVQPVDNSELISLHPLHISRILSQIFPRDIVKIRKTSRSRVIVEMRNQEANRLIFMNSCYCTS